MKIQLQAKVRGSNQPDNDDDSWKPLRMNNMGHLLISNSLPLSSETVRLGNSYQVITATATAPVAALPTTAALIGLWNGEPDNGKSYIIDSAFLQTVAGTANQQSCCLLANVNLISVPAGIANTLTPRSMIANQPYRGCARVAVGLTLNGTSGAAGNWFFLGPSPDVGGVSNCLNSIDVDCKGRFIIPPKGQFSLNALSTAATASSIQVGIRWHEVKIPNYLG